MNYLVLEFTHAVMGPSCGMILGDLGAEVLHIEPIEGDATRRLKGMGTGYFPFYSRNKKSIAIDIKSMEGKEIIYQLTQKADIVIENFAPGTMDRLGYGYEALSAINPQLIYASLKGFMDGPYEKRVAMDEVVQMMGGLAYMTGRPGDPLRAGTSVIDINGGMFGVIGILAALLQRNISGKGQFVKSALFETTAFLMGQHLAYAALSDAPVPPMPTRVSAWSVYRTFESADGEHVFIGLISDKHWVKFCQTFNKQEWIDDQRLSTNNHRIDQKEWLLPQIEALMIQFSKAEILTKCEAAGICFAPIARPEDLLTDPQLNQGQYGLVETKLPDGTIAKLPRLPLQMGESSFDVRLNPPQIGEHTNAILSDLGYSEIQIQTLKNKNIIA